MKKTIWKNPNNFNELEVNENCLIDNRTGEQFIKDENEIIQFIQKEEIDGSNKKSTDFYNSFAPFYEIGQKIWYSFFGGEKKARMDYLNYLDIKDNMTVLEVSIGTAANVKYLTKNADYYGIDISMGQLLQSVKNKNKYKLPITLCYANAESLPFKDNSFDVVYHIGGINLFNDKQKAIYEMVRVAKKDAKIMICDETEKVAQKYEKLPYFGKPFKNREKIVPPINLLPENVENIKPMELRKGTLYIITCNKK